LDRPELEHWIGAVLVPEVRVPGTYAGHGGCTPSDDQLHRFPPACVIAFGRLPRGAQSPTELLIDLRDRCVALGVAPPMVACDLEQGAGLHFEEGTRLPPALALAAAAKGHGDTGHGLNWVRSAGYVTGVEARELGVELVLAPVADVNTQRDNPIIAVRSFGDEPMPAAQRARAFLDGLHSAGAGGCAKHYPGHGDTAQDSHVELPRVDRDLAELFANELNPFRELVYSGIDAVMAGHLDVPALTRRPGLPTSLSRRAVHDVLRTEMGFDGVVLSDAMNMGALAGPLSRNARYVQALEAGCDGLLCPHDVEEAAHEILRAVRRGELDAGRLEDAATRMHALRERLTARRKNLSATGLHRSVRLGANGVGGPLADFARTAAERSLCSSGPAADWKGAEGWVVRHAFAGEPSPEAAMMFQMAGWPLDPSQAKPVADDETAGCLFLVSAETVAGGGAPGLDPGRREALEARIHGLLSEGVRVGLLWFASPQTLPREWWERPDLPVLVAFAPTPPMVVAAHRFLRGEAAATGSLPVAPG
jgi:beta-glucosidase-like glycosyl hydrolase